MLKNILKLEGASVLSTTEKKSLNGGLSEACITAQANGCTPGPLSGCINVGGSYYTTCRCCYIDL